MSSLKSTSILTSSSLKFILDGECFNVGERLRSDCEFRENLQVGRFRCRPFKVGDRNEEEAWYDNYKYLTNKPTIGQPRILTVFDYPFRQIRIILVSADRMHL
jgi:hypothetical protein